MQTSGDTTRDGEVSLRFTVSDTGIGIPPEKQEIIFRAFEQEDTSTTRKYGGTGLGLTIAARLVELMGGTIAVTSEPGRGSTFAFTAQFRLQPQPSKITTVVPRQVPHALRVLIVDDNATNRRILEQWLRSWQMEPAAVSDGLAALDALWDAVTAGSPYALVLLDARMPDIDGLELAAKIRKRPELSDVRLIMLTSGNSFADAALARRSWIDTQLLKPVQQEELLNAICRVVSSRPEDVTSSLPASDAEPVPSRVASRVRLKVLVAEDNEFNAQLLQQLLLRRNHYVRLASNGREALFLAGDDDVDLLLLDLHMPELDGLQVVQAIREQERTTAKHLPVIALTARSRKEDREQCLAAGMDDFLTKPVHAADLWVAIDRVLANGAPADQPERGLLDARVVLAACGGDGSILWKLCQKFQASLPHQLMAARDALQDADAQTIAQKPLTSCAARWARFPAWPEPSRHTSRTRQPVAASMRARRWSSSSRRWWLALCVRWMACRSKHCNTKGGQHDSDQLPIP